MTSDSQRPVMAHGHPQRSRCAVPGRLGDGRNSSGSAVDTNGPRQIHPVASGLQKRMAAAARASVLRRVGAER